MVARDPKGAGNLMACTISVLCDSMLKLYNRSINFTACGLMRFDVPFSVWECSRSISAFYALNIYFAGKRGRERGYLGA
jgi:hypothetical protein